jgi:hypothetical protein
MWYKSIFLSLVACGCEMRSHTLEEKYWLRIKVFESKVLRKMHGTETGEMIYKWRYEELRYLCRLYNIIRFGTWRSLWCAGHVIISGVEKQVGRSRYKLLGPGSAERGLEPVCITYVSVVLSSIIICWLYRLTFTDQAQVTLQLTVNLYDLV